MFGKLFVYELKATWRIYRVLLLLALVLGGPILLMNQLAAEVSTTLRVFYVLFFLYVTAAGVFSAFYPLFRFYNGLYGKEAYFLHSVPASRTQYLWSKILALSLWTLVMSALWAGLSFRSIFGTMRLADPAVWAEFQLQMTEQFGNSQHLYGPLFVAFLLNALGGVMVTAYVIIRGLTGRIQRFGVGGPILVYILVEIVTFAIQLGGFFVVPYDLVVDVTGAGRTVQLIPADKLLSMMDFSPQHWQVHLSVLVTSIVLVIFAAWRATYLFKHRFNINP